MKKLLLLIDGNQNSRTNLATFLTTLGYKVVQMESFKGALDYLANTHVHLVLVDGNLPEADQAATKIKGSFGLKTLLILSNEKITKAQALQNLGYSQSLSLPYSGEQIKASIDGLIKIQTGEMTPAEAASVEEGVGEFCGADLVDFFKNPVTRFDLYHKLNDTKYLKINRAGDMVNEDLLYRLKANNITKVFLKKEDYKKYICLNIEKISLSKDQSASEREQKMDFLVSTSGLILNNVLVEGVDKDFFMMGKQVTDTALEIISDNDYMFQLLFALNQTNEDLYRHSLGMSVYSVLLAKAMGWTAPTTHFKLSISSLYADISLRQMDPKLLAKPKMLYSHMEMRDYQEHSLNSANIIRSIGGIQEDVFQIVLNSHENIDGTGYPNRLSRTNIHPLSKVIRVADEFCSLVLKSKDNTNVLSPKEALAHMEKHAAKKLDEDTLKALKTIFSDNFFKKAG